MKKSLAIISILGLGAAGAFANFPKPITTDTTDVIQMTDALVMGADNVTVTHSYNGARHWVGSLDLKGYDGTKLVINNVTGSSSLYFGFNGVTFKNTGGDATDTLVITNTGEKFYHMGGFIADNLTLNIKAGDMYVPSSSGQHRVAAQNNATVYWSKAAPSAQLINIVLGTEGSATDTNSAVHYRVATKSYDNRVTLTAYSGSFTLYDAGGRINFNTSNIYGLTANSYVQDMGINAGATLTIGSGITSKIAISNENIVIGNGSTLVINSEEVFYNGSISDTTDSNGYLIGTTVNLSSNRTGLYYTNAATSANIVLGANNTFKKIANNAGKTLNLTLNGNVFAVNNAIDFSSFNLYIADFENDLVKISTTTEDWASHITAMYMGSALTDLEIKDGFLYSASAVVPEPAAAAFAAGLLAIALAFYRRRR